MRWCVAMSGCEDVLVLSGCEDEGMSGWVTW